MMNTWNVMRNLGGFSSGMASKLHHGSPFRKRVGQNRNIAAVRLKRRFADRLRRSCWTCALLAAAAAPAGPTHDAGRTVRIGIYQNEPKIFMDQNNQPAGIFPDLLTEIGAEEGWVLEYVPCQWADCLSKLENGRIDIMPDVAYSQERDQKYDFHETPVLTSWSQVYANPRVKVNGYNDLNGKRVAVLKDSIQQTLFEQYMHGFGFEVTMAPTSSLEEAFQQASSGSADAAIANNFFGDYFYRQYGLVKTPIVFQPATLFYATAQGKNADLLEAIDRHLTAWLQEPNSPYYTILTRWTGMAPAPVYRIPQSVYWGIGGVILLFFFAVGMILLLRGQVRARTRHLEQANQALRESQTRYQLISTVASDYMFSSRLDENGKLTFDWVAGAFEAITGYTLEEYVAHGGWRAAVHPDDLETYDGDMEKIRSNKPAVSEIRTLTKDGRTVWVRVYAHPVLDAENRELVGIYGAVQDITSRKQAEERLAESERKYRELVEHANSIILRWTHDGRITFLNDFGQRFFGYSAEEIIGRPVMGTIVPSAESDGRDLNQLMDRISADPAAFEQNVNENMRRNGERVWIAWTNKIVRDAQGRVAEVFSVGTDITDRKKAEEAIRELNAGLERRVAERTAELAVAKDRAEAADRLKSAFLATMSHELRTPLNSIIGFTGIILQELAGPLSAEQHKQLEMVRDSARHLLSLINDVLDISKIEAGQMEVHKEPFDLRSSIEKVAAIVKPLAEKKGLALHVELAPEIGTLDSDPRRVEQVLLNLLNNSIKFTERGAITLKAETAPGRLRISVADTGIGIKPEDLSVLFQPFRQIDSGLTRQHEGTGLGLAICRRLADLLGGEILATSVWEKGSVFTFTLPMKGTGES
jgi:PAS domain S-box-containing protein